MKKNVVQFFYKLLLTFPLRIGLDNQLTSSVYLYIRQTLILYLDFV